MTSRKLPGPLTLRLTVRSEAGGTGRIAWKTAKQEVFPEAQVVEYTVAGGSEWESVEVAIPAKGVTGVIRMFLPGSAATEFQKIEFSAANGKGKTWEFGE
tara:strand:+ start:4708 stop:5007 length:300 start_codon:yes stop_codon:yes gene_type:complete